MSAADSPWEILATRRILDSPYLKIRCEAVALPNGVILPDYYIVENRGWVGIVPVTEDGLFLLNNQYRHGIGQEVLEFPAGGIDEHEDNPLSAAHRELMEETGYSTTRMEPLTEMIINPPGAETRSWWYIAYDVRKTGEQKLDPSEMIDNLLVTPEHLLQLVHSGKFAVQGQIAAAYMALERLGYLKANF